MEEKFVEEELVAAFKKFDSVSEPNGLISVGALRHAMSNSTRSKVRRAFDKFTNEEVDRMMRDATVICSRRVWERQMNYKEFVQMMMAQ